jgi:hypothetical protein
MSAVRSISIERSETCVVTKRRTRTRRIWTVFKSGPLKVATGHKRTDRCWVWFVTVRSFVTSGKGPLIYLHVANFRSVLCGSFALYLVPGGSGYLPHPPPHPPNLFFHQTNPFLGYLKILFQEKSFFFFLNSSLFWFKWEFSILKRVLARAWNFAFFFILKNMISVQRIVVLKNCPDLPDFFLFQFLLFSCLVCL